MEELVLHNGRIITLDNGTPDATAVAVRGERIVYVGDKRRAFELVSAGARQIDLRGETLVPGFNDNHLHAVGMGDASSYPNLAGLGEELIVAVLKDKYDGVRSGELIVGSRWDYTTCPNPHRSLLDEAFPDNPVLLVQFSGHGMWVNTKTLDLIKIDRHAVDPAGGQIVRDASGEPTGVLRDMRSHPYLRKRYKKMQLGGNRNRECLQEALGQFRKAGITSVQDNTATEACWTPVYRCPLVPTLRPRTATSPSSPFTRP